MKLPSVPFQLIRFMFGTLLLIVLSAPEESLAQLTLSWQPSPDTNVVGYRLFFCQQGITYNFTKPVWEGTATTVKHNFNPLANTTYCFVVRAFDAAGNLSRNSNEACWTAPAVVLEGLSVTGPASVNEGDTATYRGNALFSSGDTGEATNTAVWRVEPSTYAGISRGQLTTSAVPTHQVVTVEASYTFGNVTKEAQRQVTIVDVGHDDADGELDFVGGTDPADASSPAATSPGVKEFNPVHIEVGKVLVDHEWRRVEINKTFQEPIVVAKIMTLNEADPAVVRISNLDNTSFKVRIQEWDYLDGVHVAEAVCYLAMERGSYRLPDGTLVEAGSFNTSSTGSFCNVAFSEAFRTMPVMVTSVSSFYGPDSVTGRIAEIGTRGFKFCMQEEESEPHEHANELITYVAWEPSSGTIGGMTFEVSRTPNAVTHELYTILFDQPFTKTPLLFTNVQTFGGSDTANVRCKNTDPDRGRILIDEEQSLDDETWHMTEVVGYMAFSVQN